MLAASRVLHLPGSGFRVKIRRARWEVRDKTKAVLILHYGQRCPRSRRRPTKIGDRKNIAPPFSEGVRSFSGLYEEVILVLYPAVGISHDGHEVDPEQDGAPVSVQGLPVLID